MGLLGERLIDVPNSIAGRHSRPDSGIVQACPEHVICTP